MSTSTNVLGTTSPFNIPGQKFTTGVGLTNQVSSAITTGSGSNSNSSNCIICPSTTIVFLQALTTKLIDMTTSLKRQFAELIANAKTPTQTGIVMVSTTVQGNISVKREYMFYLQRFGPPVMGIFDPLYLELIRAELKAGIIL